MSLSHAREKTTLAILSMAGSAGCINGRIADAFVNHLMRINPAEDLPADLRLQLAEIRYALTLVEAQGEEASVKASVWEMTEDQAVGIAGKIVDFFKGVIIAKE